MLTITTMEIPIANAIYLKNGSYQLANTNFLYDKLNGVNFMKPDKKNYPLLNILNYKFNDTFEIILVSINDNLIKRYLQNKISYISIHKIMIKLLNKKFLKILLF